MAIIQNKFFINPFAVEGDRGPLPDGAQMDGSVSYQQGYPIDYQLDPTVNPSGKDIERLQFNQFGNDITQALQQYQVWGTPNFITTTQNGGVAYPYPKNALALYDDGVNGPRIYQSLVDNNIALPTDNTKWMLIDFSNLYPNNYGFRAYLSTNQLIPGSVKTKINFDANSFGTITSGTFTASVNGIYQFNCGVTVEHLSSAHTIALMLYKNGSEWSRVQTSADTADTTTITSINLSDLINLQVNDYVEVYASQGDGSSKNLLAGSNLTYFGGFKIEG